MAILLEFLPQVIPNPLFFFPAFPFIPPFFVWFLLFEIVKDFLMNYLKLPIKDPCNLCPFWVDKYSNILISQETIKPLTRGRESNRLESFKSGKVATFSLTLSCNRRVAKSCNRRVQKGQTGGATGCRRGAAGTGATVAAGTGAGTVSGVQQVQQSFKIATWNSLLQKHLAPIIFVFWLFENPFPSDG